MKKVVLFVIGMTALCVHSATLEEARQIIREHIDELDVAKYRHFHDRLNSPQYKHAFSAVNAIDRDVRMAVYLEMIKEKPDDPRMMRIFIERFLNDDGWNLGSPGNQEALGWARKVLENKDGQVNPYHAQTYLLRKGDARDIDIIGYAPGSERRTFFTDDVNISQIGRAHV